MSKVLFLSTDPSTFRAIAIGYLYEIAQKHRVALLIEKIDSHTEKILGERDLFPGLEDIIFFESPFHGDIFAKNRRLHKILKETVRRYKPDIVVAPSDIWPAEMYLMRLAKKAGAITVAMQFGFRIAEQQKLFLWSCLMNAHTRMPRFLPFGIRMMLVKLKKLAGYVLYHWILPLSVGEMPFLGKVSFLFWYESSGLRDADYGTVFSKREYEIYAKDGVPPEKIRVIGHPLEHKHTREFFGKAYFSQGGNHENQKTLTIMWSEEKTGFREGDYSLISAIDMRESRIKQVALISEKLADWKIFIKPNPFIKDVSEVSKSFRHVPANVRIVDPKEPADVYIEKSAVVVGMPPPSTTLFSAQKQRAGKIILALNLDKEFLADAYKNFPGITYISTKQELEEILEKISRNTYEPQNSIVSALDFSDSNELIEHLHAKHIR